MSDKIVIVSEEGKEHETSAQLGEMSKLIKTVLEEYHEEETPQRILLQNIKSETIERVLEFCRSSSYKNVPPLEKPINPETFKDQVPAWELEFIGN